MKKTDPYLNGGTIPLISHDETDVQWVEPMQAKCLLESPNSSWRYAHISYRDQEEKWEEKLRVLNKERILRKLNN